MSKKEISKKKQIEEDLVADDDYEYVTIPPDGGFGWVIAFAAMVFSWFSLCVFNFSNYLI